MYIINWKLIVHTNNLVPKNAIVARKHNCTWKCNYWEKEKEKRKGYSNIKVMKRNKKGKDKDKEKRKWKEVEKEKK